MGDLDEIQFTVQTFQKVLASEQNRLAVGLKLRDWIHAEVEAGREPDHYRMEWMHMGIRHLIKELEQIGRAFNASHQNDKFSTADMIDIATSVSLTLKNYLDDDENDVPERDTRGLS